MSTFEVTPSDLQSLASQLSGLLGELEQASGNVSSGASGAAQNGQLEGSIDGFLSDWASGIDGLSKKLDNVVTRLGAAGHAYEGTENKVLSHIGR